jgi:hypothetical protein
MEVYLSRNIVVFLLLLDLHNQLTVIGTITEKKILSCFVRGGEPLNMVGTEVPKKTMRLCKFHSCSLSTCIGL